MSKKSTYLVVVETTWAVTSKDLATSEDCELSDFSERKLVLMPF